MKKVLSGLIISALISVSAMALTVPANHIVDVAWLKSHMGDKNLVIVDARKDSSKYKVGHIKGAVLWKSKDFREGRYYSKVTKKAIPGYVAAPLTFKRTMKKSGINNNSTVIFYSSGTSSKDYRNASLADFTSEYYGFSNVAILDGGFAGWKKDGGAVSTERTKVKRGNFSFKGRKFNQTIMSTGEDVDEAVWTGDAQTLDATGKSKHWYGTAKDPRRLHEGHLRGAKALSAKVLTVKKDGVYYLGDKSFATKKFTEAGLNVNKPIISYCNTGHLAAGPWFVGKYVIGMGDKSRMYSGSMADYTRWPHRILVKGDK
ncbi:MAG: sulfurtransferase [Epsilonproteobacteria bacterium]|nr:sulfurtransferase [Campylobacterota bacterium]